MADLDPNEYEMAELGPAIKDVDDADELREMLALEEDGEDRVPVKTLIEDRIEKVEADDEGDLDPDYIGLDGSPTIVSSVDPIPKAPAEREATMVSPDDEAGMSDVFEEMRPFAAGGD